MAEPARKKKVVKLEEAIGLIPSGSSVAVGGLGLYGAPMAMVREVIRQGIRDLSLILPPGASMAADMLIGSESLREVLCSYIGFEDLGLAPNFRRAAESGKLRIIDADEAFVVFGLKAGAARSPFFVLPEGMAGYETARVNPKYFCIIDPRTGKSHLCVSALNPDIALIHAAQCDSYGNARHLGNCFTDLLMAKAATKRVIVSCDELIDVSETQKNPQLTSVPGFIVDAVVQVPYGCHPLSSPGLYKRDDRHLQLYLQQCASEKGLHDYLEEFVLGSDFAQYNHKIGRETFQLLSQGNGNG